MLYVDVTNTSSGKGKRVTAVQSSRRKQIWGAKSVGSLLPKITKAVFEKHGFPAVALLTDWPAIAGAELASFTCPEKLTWPKREYRAPDEDFAARKTRKPARGITLKLRVEGHRALEIEYGKEELLDRINRYFGYRAVTDLRIVQGPVTSASEKRVIADHQIRAAPDAPKPDLSAIDDEGLRAALDKLDKARRSGGKSERP